MMKAQWYLGAVLLAVLVIFLGRLRSKNGGKKMEKITISSNKFKNRERLPVDYTCDGKDISPHISWNNIPAAAKSIALICDDPDAPGGTWDHWIVFNIPTSITAIPEGASTRSIALGVKQGTNSWKRTGFGGACPPRGHGTHRYIFSVYALDAQLDLDEGATKAQVLAAIKGHILGEGQLIGTYSRAKQK